MNIEKIFIWSCVVLLVYLGMIGIQEVSLEMKCLSHGYPGSRITFLFEKYCVKRNEATDIVVPLEKIE